MHSLLVIGYVWPEPRSSAAGTHTMSLIQLFRREGWQITFASPAQTTEHMEDLQALGISTVMIELNSSSFDSFVHDLSPELVLFDRFMMEEQFGWRVEQQCPQAIRILDTSDLQFLRYARQQAHKGQRDVERSDYFSDIAKREIAAILRSDLSLIISSYEYELLTRDFGISPEIIHHLPFMVDLTTLPTMLPGYQERQHFITIGNFRHAPNWDSVLYLQQIWPRIRKELPSAELHIYGSYPPKKATQMDNPEKGFRVLGRADDALESMATARVCLAPLRFGAGIKGKLLDAMKTQTPSVTTPIGIEGMSEPSLWPGLVGQDPEQIASSAIRLYTDEALWSTLQGQAVPLLEKRYEQNRLGQQLMEQAGLIKANLETHRLKNFSGAMLRFHTARSTEFMSRWIELKNRLEAD